MHKNKFFLFACAVIGIALAVALLVAADSASAQRFLAPQTDEGTPATPKVSPAEHSAAPAGDNAPEWEGAWVEGPPTPFQLTRFDGEYDPGTGKVYFLGGRLADGTTDGSIWSYDPATGAYADMGVDLPVPISNYEVNLLQDENGWGLYVFCGRDSAGGQNLAPQVYYPDTNTAVSLASDLFPGTESSCSSAMNAVWSNQVYLAGGFNSTANTDETWVFDPMAAAGSRWTQLASALLATPRAYIMGAVVDDKIYAIGGNYFDGSNLINVMTVEVLDPAAATPVWDDASVADLPEECSSGRAWGFNSDTSYVDPDGTRLAGRIISTCGFWPDENNHVLAYNTSLDYWEVFPSLITDRRDNAAAFLPSTATGAGVPGLWVWGGRKDTDGNVLQSSEYYAVEAAAGACNVLLVDDDWDQYSAEPYNGTGTGYYTTTLEALGVTYDRWDSWTLGDPGLADLQPYDAVVWFTGYAWEGTITSTTEASLAAYLDGGGNLFLSATDYLYEMGLTTFGQGYLGISSSTEDTGELDPTGNAGDPIGDGLGPYALTTPTSWPAGDPDIYSDDVSPGPGASSPFRFVASGENNSTDYDSGSWKTAFVAWPIEGLADLNDRVEVLGSALDWMCGPDIPAGMEVVPPAQTGGGPAGTDVSYTLTILNSLGTDETFDVTYTSAWPIAGPTIVGPVPDGGSQDFIVTVTVPEGYNCYESDIATIDVAAQFTTPYSDTAYLTTSVDPAGVVDMDGTITDANTGLGIPNAYMFLELGEDEYYDTWADQDGAYLLANVPACTYRGGFEGFGYNSVYNDVTLVVEEANTFDVELTASIPLLTPDTISAEVLVDTTKSYNLTLENLGSGDLDWHVSEVPADSPVPGALSLPTLPNGVDPQVYADLKTAEKGTTQFIVYMKAQADLSAAFGMEDWSARGQYVLDTLKATADASQARLKADLDAAGASYESHYIVNALIVDGDRILVDQIAARGDVAYIGVNEKTEAPAPVEILPSSLGPTALEWNIQKVQADTVWSEFATTGEGIVIAGIDTGVMYDHPALVNQYRGNLGGTFDHEYNWWDPYGNYPDFPGDVHGHGTHTMGTMVGSDLPNDPLNAPNGIGMAPGAKWIACSGLNTLTGSGSIEGLIECAEFILAPWDADMLNPDPNLRADIVNNSWGGGQAQFWFEMAAYAWRAAGILPTFSNGNSGPNCGTAGDPGDSANIMSVGASDINDAIAGFSSRGPAAITGILKPNVTAPGVNVRSSIPNGGYQGGWNGTSMAAPHVAGEAALIWSAVPSLRGDVQLTYWIIEQTALRIDSAQCDPAGTYPNNVYGYGRINAYDAVTLALSEQWDIPWLTVTPVNGPIVPGGNRGITLDLDATGLTVGECYTGTLLFDYNDPFIVQQSVPVEMCVTEEVIVEIKRYLPVILQQ